MRVRVLQGRLVQQEDARGPSAAGRRPDPEQLDVRLLWHRHPVAHVHAARDHPVRDARPAARLSHPDTATPADTDRVCATEVHARHTYVARGALLRTLWADGPGRSLPGDRGSGGAGDGHVRGAAAPAGLLGAAVHGSADGRRDDLAGDQLRRVWQHARARTERGGAERDWAFPAEGRGAGAVAGGGDGPVGRDGARGRRRRQSARDGRGVRVRRCVLVLQ